MIDLESRLSFDGQIGTEQRFAFRSWVEKWCGLASESLAEGEWSKDLSADFSVSGLTERTLDVLGWCEFLSRRHEQGRWVLRLPSGLVKRLSADEWQLRGEVECYTHGVLSFAGHISASVGVSDRKFLFKKIVLAPRFRVSEDW